MFKSKKKTEFLIKMVILGLSIMQCLRQVKVIIMARDGQMYRQKLKQLKRYFCKIVSLQVLHNMIKKVIVKKRAI